MDRLCSAPKYTLPQCLVCLTITTSLLILLHWSSQANDGVNWWVQVAPSLVVSDQYILHVSHDRWVLLILLIALIFLILNILQRSLTNQIWLLWVFSESQSRSWLYSGQQKTVLLMNCYLVECKMALSLVTLTTWRPFLLRPFREANMMESCPTMLQERTLENFLLGTSYTARH